MTSFVNILNIQLRAKSDTTTSFQYFIMKQDRQMVLQLIETMLHLVKGKHLMCISMPLVCYRVNIKKK